MRSSAKQRSLSEAELLEYSKEHLRYEIEMFFGVGILLSETALPANDNEAVIRNALVESFVIHLRNLLLFLYPHSHGDNDVISDDFFVDTVKDWKCNRPKITSALEDARTRSHREISHLTAFRRDGRGESKDWPVLQLMQEIKSVLQAFVNNASAARLDSSMKSLVDSIDPTKTFRAVTDPSTASLQVGHVTYVSSSLPQYYKKERY